MRHFKYQPLVVSILLCFSLNLSWGQTKINRNTELRFIGNITGDFHDDPMGMLQDFTLGLEWWSLLGEPVEMYTIKWHSTGSYRVNLKGKTVIISRDMVAKYPDLLKRFDNLRPSKMDLVVYGQCEGNTSAIKRGGVFPYSAFYGKGSAYKKNGQSYDPYTLSAHILHTVHDRHLLFSKSGKWGKSLVPESPKVWNQFLNWKQRTSNFVAPNTEIDYLVLNKTVTKYNSISKSQQDDLDKKLKYLFNNTTTMALNVQVVKLEWPETEMRSIAQLFDEYETGKTKPSPLEEITEAKKEIANQTKYENNDFWGELANVKPLETEIFKNGKYTGVRYKGTNTVIIPAKYYGITEVGNYFAVVLTPPIDNTCSKWDREEFYNNQILLDKNGRVVMSERFNAAYGDAESIVVSRQINFELVSYKSKSGRTIRRVFYNTSKTTYTLQLNHVNNEVTKHNTNYKKTSPSYGSFHIKSLYSGCKSR